ncbi:hypothetical protein SPI_04391 [Niveomyces insectorum RCEF 264]|uniref:Uncharacterized protein n=1 Tax=Niveomyces insectorum RCEF 264 TaxID=1081102 RepID=A0A167VPH9_9HYPO|nr:hypothetical protein SPI_04391 [Niveomyces insectorum RCEF 264]
MAHPRLPSFPDSHIADDNQAREMKLMLLHHDLEDMQKAQADPSNSNNFDKVIKNVGFLIDFYQKGGDLPRPTGIRWVADGQFVEVDGDWPEPYDAWAQTSDAEGTPAQLAQGAAIFGPGNGPWKHMHLMTANVRIAGHDENVVQICFGNSTGSSIQTLHEQDLVQLPGVPFRSEYVATAAGLAPFRTCGIEMQITRNDPGRSALTRWYKETALVNHDRTARLSGNGMRNHLYFATTPGNAVLYVGDSKDALEQLLPAESG